MAQETSYDVKPFNHDTSRGKWSSPRDFLYACLGHAFKVDAVFILPSVLIVELGLYGIIPYFLILATCVVPIVFMQSFLGQFSSTGFLSVFRIAPLFKGIGYVSLAINFVTLMYFSVFAAIPLFYFLNTLQPTLPWGCEGVEEWMEIKNNTISVCDKLTKPLVNETMMEVPSLEFFRVHLKTMDMHKSTHPEGTFSWPLMLCTFVVWIITTVITTKSVDKVGRFLRYSCIAVVTILALCVVRFAFLPGAIVGLERVITYPSGARFADVWIALALVALSSLGPGWGSVLTMASYNKFKTNVEKYSWLLCLAQFGVVVAMGLMATFVTNSLQRHQPEDIYFVYRHTQWMEFLVTPTALTFMELPHIWSLLFFAMMILGSLNLLIVQLFSVLTSLFDEYESLREKKRQVTFWIIGFLALISIYFCSNYGFTFSEILSRFSMMTQVLLNILLLVVVVWVYGRERFQRDLRFMTSRDYATWKINIIKFVAPLTLLIGFFGAFVLSVSFGYVTLVMVPVAAFGTLAMWCYIPGHCILQLKRAKGMLGKRFKRSVVPVNWSPVEPHDRQRYEQGFPTLLTANNTLP